MTPKAKRKEFKHRFWVGRDSVCEVCGGIYNFKHGAPVTGMRMDRAHLVAKFELKQFGDVGEAFNYDSENFAALCRLCHRAMDNWLGANIKKHRFKSRRFVRYYDNFLPLLRRRHRLMLTLISLTSK